MGRSCSSRLATKTALRQSSGTSKRQGHMHAHAILHREYQVFDVICWRESAEDVIVFEEVAPKFKVTCSFCPGIYVRVDRLTNTLRHFCMPLLNV
jgi:hypothetical protein